MQCENERIDEEILKNPYKAIENFRTALIVENPAADELCSDEFVRNSFRHKIYEAGFRRRIPLLKKSSMNFGELQSNSFVKFFGMVQDMYTSEFYAKTIEQFHAETGVKRHINMKYRDSIPQEAGWETCNLDSSEVMERQPIYCTSIPGISSWTQENGDSCEFSAQMNSPRDSNKRPRYDSFSENLEDTNICDESNLIRKSHPKFKSPLQDGHSSNSVFPYKQEVDFPELSCLAYDYDLTEDEIKLNDMIEFFGILSFSNLESEEHSCTENSVVQNTAEMLCFDGMQDTLPSSLVPRLHIITYRKVSVLDLVDSAQFNTNGTSTRGIELIQEMMPSIEVPEIMKIAQKGLLQFISSCIDGDMLSAEYILFALVAKRLDDRKSMDINGVFAGTLSISLTQDWSEASVKRLYTTLTKLVPILQHFELTAQVLSSEYGMAPCKDYKRSRLMLSALQLAKGTVLLVDEMKLEPSQISATKSLHNLSALQSVLHKQLLPYDFKFYKLDFEADHPAIVLTNKGNGMSKAHIELRLELNHDMQDTYSVVEEDLKLWRLYILVVRQRTVDIEDSLCKVAERDWISSRQADPSLTPDNFNIWLTVSRLIAKCEGSEKVSACHWQRMKVLESCRRNRLKNNVDTALNSIRSNS